MSNLDAVAAALRNRPYDSRLDSGDVIERQQAEIEALRTCLIASNSDSCDEYARLQAEIERLKASYAGQLRNTLAFKTDADTLRQALDRAAMWFFAYNNSMAHPSCDTMYCELIGVLERSGKVCRDANL